MSSDSEAIQTIKAFHERRSFGTAENLYAAERQVGAAYRSLSRDECRQLGRFALENSDETILSHLACLLPGSLVGLHREFVERGIFYPPVIFHGADEEASALLMEQLETGHADNANLALLALAWADNPTVLRAFQKWRSDSRSWAESLHIPPHEYADSAGWELAENGQRRSLVLRECYPLVARDDPNGVPDAVQINRPSAAACEWCGRRMTVLFDFDLTHEMLQFVGIEGHRLRIETCDVCTCYGFVFTKLDELGGASWHPANARPDYLPEDTDDWDFPEANALVLSRKSRACLESADRNMPIAFSQVGGYPSWEQDAEYPRCPECQQRMTFLAQLSNHDYNRLAEGIYYAFACGACRVAATHYQQT